MLLGYAGNGFPDNDLRRRAAREMRSPGDRWWLAGEQLDRQLVPSAHTENRGTAPSFEPAHAGIAAFEMLLIALYGLLEYRACLVPHLRKNGSTRRRAGRSLVRCHPVGRHAGALQSPTEKGLSVRAVQVRAHTMHS